MTTTAIPQSCNYCTQHERCAPSFSRRLKTTSWCGSFQHAEPVPGVPVAELEAQEKHLQESLLALHTQLRPGVLALRDLEHLNREKVLLKAGELAAARAKVTVARDRIRDIAQELVDLGKTLASRRVEEARSECWGQMCQRRRAAAPDAPRTVDALALDRLIEARQRWQAAGFVLAEAFGIQGLHADAWSDFLSAATALHAAVAALKEWSPILSTCGDDLLLDLGPIPERARAPQPSTRQVAAVAG